MLHDGLIEHTVVIQDAQCIGTWIQVVRWGDVHLLANNRVQSNFTVQHVASEVHQDDLCFSFQVLLKSD